MKQCAWVYTEGGQYGGQCMKDAMDNSVYCAEHLEVRPMNFGQALEYLKQGLKVACHCQQKVVGCSNRK